MSYGLGNLNDNLPTFVVLPDPRGLPYNATGNFSQGFLPAAHQGTMINPNAEIPIANLQSAGVGRARSRREAKRPGCNCCISSTPITSPSIRATRGSKRGWRRTNWRRSCSSARRRCSIFPTKPRRRWPTYGVNDDATYGFGRNCLIARRLLERDVRFVQVWSGMDGATNNWDNHSDIPKELPLIARSVDRPIAALLRDLKQRGMLEDTLVIWTTEFGRMPFTQGADRPRPQRRHVRHLAGRRRNRRRNELWPERRVRLSGRRRPHVLLRSCTPRCCTCSGIDHKRLTFRHNGIDRRLTDVHGHVIREIFS